jgi:hypothetical protein
MSIFSAMQAVQATIPAPGKVISLQVSMSCPVLRMAVELEAEWQTGTTSAPSMVDGFGSMIIFMAICPWPKAIQMPSITMSPLDLAPLNPLSATEVVTIDELIRTLARKMVMKKNDDEAGQPF